MKSVILISEGVLDLDALVEASRPHGRVARQSECRMVVQLDPGWFAVECDASLRDDFEEEELLRLLEQVEQPNFAQLYFSDDRAVDVAIEILPLDPQVLVDNDNDLVAPVSEIRRRIQAGESWRTATA
jgi:hypothetical protein